MTQPNPTEDTYMLLRDKLKSKMEVAKFFVGTVAVVFGLLAEKVIFSDGVDHQYLIALVLLVLSVFASGAAIFAYDALLVPPLKLKAYCGDEPVDDYLFRKMVRSWQIWFVPAVVLFALAMVLFIGTPILNAL